jgi:hypothetical protein
VVDREGIPEKVTQFLWSRIDSVMQLEALLLLHADPARVWTPEEIAAELRTDPGGARQQIAPLIPRGLIRPAEQQAGESPAASQDRIQFGAATPELEGIMRQVASLYALRRVTIISLIYSRPAAASEAETVASAELDPIRQFAEAFRLRRPPQGTQERQSSSPPLSPGRDQPPNSS